MNLLLTIVSGIFILFGISLMFSKARLAMLAAIVCVGSGMLAYDEKSFIPLAAGFGLLWVLRLLGGERE